MSLRSFAAVFALAMLLLASGGGVVCEASCVPAGEAHACCAAPASGDAVAVSAAPCRHPAHEQAAVTTAAMFLTPVILSATSLDAVSFAIAPAARAVPGSSSPPVFPLRI